MQHLLLLNIIVATVISRLPSELLTISGLWLHLVV